MMEKHNNNIMATFARTAFFILFAASILCQGIEGRKVVIKRSSSCQHCQRRETCETDCRLAIGEVENITCWVPRCDAHSHTVDIYRVEVEGEQVIRDDNTLPGLQGLWNADGCSLLLTYEVTPDINDTVLQCSAVDGTGRLTYSKSIRIGVQIDTPSTTTSSPSSPYTSSTAPNETTSSVGIEGRKVALNRTSSCQHCQRRKTCETDCRLAIGEVENITCWVPHCSAHSHTVDIYRVEVEGERVIRDDNTLPGLQGLWNADGCSLHLTYEVTPDINDIVLQCSAVMGTGRPIYSKSIRIGVQTDPPTTAPPIISATPSDPPGSTTGNTTSATQTLTYCTFTIVILAGLSVFVTL